MSSSEARRAQRAQEKAQYKLDREPFVLDFAYNPNALLFHGPIIVTDLTITEAHRQALEAAGQPIPGKVPCRFLIDTGADGCVVKHEIADKAALKLINANIPLHGVGVDTTGKSYMGRIVFGCASKQVKGATLNVTVDTEIVGGKLETDLIDGLIGRNVLQQWELTYNGVSGRFRMRFIRP